MFLLFFRVIVFPCIGVHVVVCLYIVFIFIYMHLLFIYKCVF